MSTHNIGFYEDLAKNYLSIIIKYAPYLFFWAESLLFLFADADNKRPTDSSKFNIFCVMVLITAEILTFLYI